MDLQLETPRLLLRPLSLGDVGAVRSLLIDPDVRRWMCDGQVLPEATVRAAVEQSLAGFRWRGAGMFALRLKVDGAFAGIAGLKPARLGGVELGAGVWPRHWRHGLAGEACRAVLDDAFGRVGLERVLACTDAPNFRSLALIARLGFRPLVNTPGAFGAIRWFARARE
ncbi:MAG TPA: GNAT family N-acetyltransferase [Anaeromyxobacter sp.]